MISEERKKKFKKAASRRQNNLTVILENVHDPHNIGAVLRTCDSVGIHEVFVLYSEKQLDQNKLVLGKRTSSGARRWVDVHYYDDIEKCFEHVRKNYDLVLATHLDKEAVSLYELDLTQSVALLYGNERDGISEETLAHADGNFLIPQMGFVQSLNISVACAIGLYEALRQREAKGMYTDNPPMTKIEQEALYQTYVERHESKDKRHFTTKK